MDKAKACIFSWRRRNISYIIGVSPEYWYWPRRTYEEEICVLACPLRANLVKVLKEFLPPSTVFGTPLVILFWCTNIYFLTGTNSHSLTRSDFLQVYREYCKFTKVPTYRPVEDQILLDSARSDEPFSRLDISRVLRDNKQVRVHFFCVMLKSISAGSCSGRIKMECQCPTLRHQHKQSWLFGLNLCIRIFVRLNWCILWWAKLYRISHTLNNITSIDLSDNKLGRESSPFLSSMNFSFRFVSVLKLICSANGIDTPLEIPTRGPQRSVRGRGHWNKPLH